jgi:hypothetical protein
MGGLFVGLKRVIDPLSAGFYLMIGLAILIPIMGFVFTQGLRRIRLHGKLLADSIASKITSNPAALIKAILKLRDLGLLGAISTSWFSDIKPPKRGELAIDLKEGPANLPARIANLEAIEQGHWPVFGS